MRPILIVNFKVYKEAIGENAVKLARVCEVVSKQTGYVVAIAPQVADIARIASSVEIPIFAQHIDAVEYGAHTGSIIAESAMEAGAFGTLINHSEKRLDIDVIEKTVRRAKELGLITCVCAKDATEAGRLATLKPDFVAYEPPELIGGDVSVSSSKPDVIKKAVAKIGKNSLCIVGAGVKNKGDVKRSIELGAKGVLVASGVVLAKDQKRAILELIKGFIVN